MNVHQIIVDSINEAVCNVFSTMVGGDLGPGTDSVALGAPEASDGVVSFIGIAGRWAGTGSLSCSSGMACAICSRLLMTETTAVNEEVLDAVAELTNMIIGGVKNDLERHVGSLGLSIPTVVFGRNFKTRSVGSTEWIVVRFPWNDQELAVKVSLAPSERVAQLAPHVPTHACAMDV
ncbi:MAG TPA: chemotaxis protein CheX [Candidatus Acidoferrales bacterium]|nr:chemotaxis protein CheX [Candidatus Acidoferrales bacterium]